MFQDYGNVHQSGKNGSSTSGKTPINGKIKWLSLIACLVVLLVGVLALAQGAFSSTQGAHAASAKQGVKSPKHGHSPSSPGKSKPVLSASPLSLSFSASTGSPTPPFQTVIVKNGGTRALYWHAAVSTGAAWVTTSDQKSQPLGIRTTLDQSGQLKVYVNATGLKAGTYMAHITLTGTDQQSQPAAGSPQTITVTLTVS
ncbi:MAG: hypothetical protein H0V70_20875 [Ktedonobacteraceae bacterium]|nr:hypothetical protein [Ktedonobacteraceae bacterium]